MASYKNVTANVFHILELPPFITSILGVGTLPAPWNSHGTIVKDSAGSNYACLDGERVALILPDSNGDPIPDPTDLQKAIDVFGITREELTALPWGSGKYISN